MFWIENDFIDEGYLAKTSGNAIKVLLAITRHYNKAGTCYPSIRRLSKLVGLTQETTSKCIKQLELLGYLEQLEIKERCKLHYKFSKTALFFRTKDEKLPEKSDTKEYFKESIKERLKKENLDTYNKLYGSNATA